MTDTELRHAIDQAWAHTQKTSPGPELEEAKQHLTHLRAVQAARAKHGRAPQLTVPEPPPSSRGI